MPPLTPFAITVKHSFMHLFSSFNFRCPYSQGCIRDLSLRDRDIPFLVRDETETKTFLQFRETETSDFCHKTRLRLRPCKAETETKCHCVPIKKVCIQNDVRAVLQWSKKLCIVSCKRDPTVRDRDESETFDFQSETRSRPSHVSTRPRRDQDVWKLRQETDASRPRLHPCIFLKSSQQDRGQGVVHARRQVWAEHWVRKNLIYYWMR